MATALEKLFADAKDKAKKSSNNLPFWKPEFREDTPEAAWAFCLQTSTWDEATAQKRKMPDHDYLKEIVYEWHYTRAIGKPLFIEKSRRLVVSWLLCALDVWDAGLRKCNIVQGGKDFEKASDFVWRCFYIYDELRKDYPHWRLQEAKTWGNPLSQHLDGLAFPNGSIVTPLNSDGESFRGSGYTRVKLEELSSYRYVEQVVSQAKAVTQGPPGQIGGHLVGVCNAAPNPEWKKLKKRPESIGKAPSVQSQPYQVYESVDGNRVLRIHFSCDPGKDSLWVELTKPGWAKREWRREMELEDEEVDDALWTQQLIDDTRVNELPPNIVQILVSVDPNTTTRDITKPNHQPDEAGIIIGAIADDYHAYIISDESGEMSPLEWARKAVNSYSKYKANRIIAEANQGGEMVEITIHQVSPMIPVQRVHASIGKRARAEPVAAAYELGKIHHLGVLEDLETEMTTWSKASTKSPNRIDALTQLIKASGILEMLAGTVTDRFKEPEVDPTLDFVPEGTSFKPYEEEPEDTNPWSSLGW